MFRKATNKTRRAFLLICMKRKIVRGHPLTQAHNGDGLHAVSD